MPDTATLAVDYSDGAHKTFHRIPLGEDAAVCDVLDRAAAIGPGLAYTFDVRFVDRAGGERGTIASVDGIAAGDGHAWAVWIDAEPVGEMRRKTAGTLGGVASPPVPAGAVVTLKRVARPAAEG